MRVHRTSVGDIEIAEVEIPDMMSVEAAGDDFGMHRFVDGVKSVNRRTEIMVTRLLVHELFGDDAMLCHEPSGAPYVEKAGARMDMGFSLSHCRGWVVAAWSASERVGVDVEIVDKRVDRVKDRVFFVRLQVGVNAKTKLYRSIDMPSRLDTVSFRVTGVDEENGIALGFITRIIKRHTRLR